MAEPTRVLILGGTGMLGHTLFECLSRRPGLDVHATVRSPSGWPRHPDRISRIHSGVDAADFDTVERAISEVRPDVVVNCIGVVKQSPEMTDPVVCIQLNALLPHLLARRCAGSNTRLVHFSTDCVFSGAQGGYSEDDAPDPVDRYDRTKLLGEPCGTNGITLRTSLIGHELRGRLGLLEWFLAATGPVRGFTRAIFSGFPTVEMARILAEFVLPNPRLAGIFHLSSPPISKCDLLESIARRYGKEVVVVPCREPAIDRSLDSQRFQAATGYRSPSWRELLDAMFLDALARYPSPSRPGADPPAARVSERGAV